MSEVLTDICIEAETVISNVYTNVSQYMSRTAIVHAFDADVEIMQHKYLNPDEAQLILAEDAKALATTAWFNDVEWLTDTERRGWSSRRLQLDAQYPMGYFEEEPRTGSFTITDGVKRWQDQYGSISGFGSRSETTVWTPSFVAEGDRAVTRLRYPDDPTAMDQYNDRYRRYLQTLDEADTMLSHRLAWEQHDTPEAAVVIGGMSLYGIGIDRVLRQGNPATDEENATAIHFHLWPETDSYFGRILTITADGATTEDYFDDDEEQKEATDEILASALELLQNLSSSTAH